MGSDVRTVRVQRIRREAADIASFKLVDPAGAQLPGFTAGAHIDVHVAPGLVRQYSLCNGPGETGSYVIAVKREPASRGGSAAMHEQVREGDLLTISAPRNNFPLQIGAGHHILLAGGIGITPILSMARHLLAAEASFELLYFTRSPAHTAFHELLGGAAFADKVRFHHDLAPEGVRALLAERFRSRPAGAEVYLCGPKPFMDLAVETTAPAWPAAAVHLEYFTADPAALAGGEAFQVTLARSGGTYAVPEDKSIVEALREQGVVIEVSCEQGICGTCLTDVLEGVPDHRDMFLTDEEKEAGNKLTPCVSRSKSQVLVLDV